MWYHIFCWNTFYFWVFMFWSICSAVENHLLYVSVFSVLPSEVCIQDRCLFILFFYFFYFSAVRVVANSFLYIHFLLKCLDGRHHFHISWYQDAQLDQKNSSVHTICIFIDCSYRVCFSFWWFIFSCFKCFHSILIISWECLRYPFSTFSLQNIHVTFVY